jgi:hypothetical protein
LRPRPAALALARQRIGGGDAATAVAARRRRRRGDRGGSALTGQRCSGGRGVRAAEWWRRRQRGGGVGVRSGRYFFRHVFYGRVEYTKVTLESWLQYKLQKL